MILTNNMQVCVAVLVVMMLVEVEGVERGPLVLVGGNLAEDNAEIYEKMVELSGGKGSARIAVVTSANANAESSGQYYKDMFKRYGAATVYWVPVQEADPGAGQSSEVVGNILTMGGIFFGGGDPWRIVKTLFTETGGVRSDTPVLTAIKTKWEVGAMVAGTSAGIEAMQSNIIIIGGQNYNALAYGATASSTVQDNLTYDPLGGLGFLSGVVIDAHFSEKERQARLTRLVSDTRGETRGAMRGLGLDENTALVCQAGVCEVIGRGGVWAVDLGQASIQEVDGWWRCDKAVTTYITPGDTINLSTWSVQLPTWKSSLVTQGSAVATSNHLFTGTIYRDGPVAEYTRVVNSLMQSTSLGTFANTYQGDPVLYQVQFVKNSDTAVVRGQRPSTSNTFTSYKNLQVNFVPGYLDPKQ